MERQFAEPSILPCCPHRRLHFHGGRSISKPVLSESSPSTWVKVLLRGLRLLPPIHLLGEDTAPGQPPRVSFPSQHHPAEPWEVCPECGPGSLVFLFLHLLLPNSQACWGLSTTQGHKQLNLVLAPKRQMHCTHYREISRPPLVCVLNMLLAAPARPARALQS